MATSTFQLPPAKGDVRTQTSDLCRHLRQCAAMRGRFFSAFIVAERVHGVVAPRFVTTVVCATLLLLLCGGA